ncbi:MAG: winged helix-turn-helix transcriptional regulator [Anaerovoracaceae bacterium]
MTGELDILKILAENPNISQRKLAEQTGVSLGQINFLLKKCVKKGLIKIEGQTSKSIKYNLTPKGMAEKAALTLQYVRVSYAAVISLTDKIRELADSYEADYKKIYVYGNPGEMMEICKLALANRGSYLTKSTKMIKLKPEAVVFLWEEQDKEIFDNPEDIILVNVLI